MCEYLEIGEKKNPELASLIARKLKDSGVWDGMQLVIIEDAAAIYAALSAEKVRLNELEVTQKKFRLHVSLPDTVIETPSEDILFKVWQVPGENALWHWRLSVYEPGMKHRDILDSGIAFNLEVAAMEASESVELYRSGGL